MTDQELIARLRDWPYQGETMANAAADRIELLVKDAKAQESEIANLGENLDAQKRRADQLEAKLVKALETLEFISDDLDANLERVTLMARATVAALKGDDHV